MLINSLHESVEDSLLDQIEQRSFRDPQQASFIRSRYRKRLQR